MPHFLLEAAGAVSLSVVAFATTMQAALAALQRSRSPGARQLPLLAPTAVLMALPWIHPTVGWLVGSLAAQVAWFAACEKLGTRARPASAGPARSKGAIAVSRLRAKAFVPVQVLGVHDESAAVRTFRMSRPEGFTFAAGQFLMVRCQINGQTHARCYSISSAPDEVGYLEISVRRQGLVSGALHDTAVPGSVLFVKPPAGRFVYPAGDRRPVVLVAGGVGITPCISMLRHAVVHEPFRPVTLLFSVKSEDDVPFEREIAAIAKLNPQVRVVITVTRAAGSTRHHVGRIDESLVRAVVRSPHDSLCYMCGPPPMVGAAREALVAAGVPDQQIHDEVFQTKAAIGAGTAPACKAIHAKLAFARSGRVVEVNDGATLLESAEAAGVAIPSLCRSGACGTCKTRLVSGEVQFSSDAIDPDERAEGYILPCVAWPAGDCELEA
jgi:ferredoxin-NADP reductase